MIARIHPSRTQLAALGALVVVFGGVACSAVNSELATHTVGPPAATTAPQNLKAPQPPVAAAQPAAVPAALPAGAAPAASDAVAQRSATSANAATGAPNAISTVPDVAAAQSLDRMVIRTAQLSVEIANMEQALAKARQIASRDGGFVSASNTHVEKVNDQDRPVADLTLQVRSSSADATLSDLRALGNVTAETSGSQDVTDEYVDLDSNLRNLQASESAILKLMERATQIQDVLALQRELTNVRGQIERIQGRKTYLERRSDMATITLSLRLPPVETSRPLASGAWDPIGVAQRGWQASLAVLRGGAEILIVVAAFSWWLVPFAGLGAYVWLHRRRGRVVPVTAAPADG